MKFYKTGTTLLVALMLLAISVEAVAQAPSIAPPIKKFFIGAGHTVFSPIEIPMSVSKMTNTYGPSWGLTVGPVNGTLSFLERMTAGIVDTLTFYVPYWERPVLNRPFGETELTDPYRPPVRVAY